ncbi:cholesterol transport system auxiliary component [Sphingomonas palmae]|uniref:Cholesterol transport system auxiliary component n=1 Tax=Sphingomonas palmae TaxID=1855283 RepID=A0A1H7T8E2_9SPHN|nr:ABC-type transport auxiliary lipoprotein family protein [Sphingomonas palmae]SEL81161.1 cholesterol transport system auxiliary component [Sphingomonas palmae]
MRHSLLRLSPIAVAIVLSGCISFGAKPPPSLLTLNATAQPQPGRTQSSADARSIVVQVPSVATALSTARVPVQASADTVAYVKDAQWTEPPARLFARLLSDTLTAQANIVVLSPVQSISDPSGNLAGELRAFGLDATTQQAVVIYDAALTRVNATAVEKRRFEARVPVSAIDAASAGASLNQAANQVAAEVATWVGGR